ncbi:hypothetical protein ABFS82_14G145400 [Erythranthe guttata]
MDSSNKISSGASSSHHVAQRTESSLVMISHSENKKRGRPRKYKPEASSSMAFSPMPPPPLSSSAPPATAKSYMEGKKPNLARQINSDRKQRNRIGAEKLDDWVDCFTGSSFLPHEITVNTGEDISTKIMEFALQGPRSVCVISGNGTVSRVKIRHPNSSGSNLTYEGLFEIIAFSGSFTPIEKPGSKFGRQGMMKISLSGADGRVVGGLIDGPTIAAAPVKVVVASFLMGSPEVVKPKKLKTEASAGPVDESSAPTKNVERNCSTISQNQTNWGTSKTVERSTADINISLHG